MGDMVRVVLVPKGAGGAAGDRQIMIDMAVDAAGSAVGPFPAFGRVGDFRKPETLFPFTLMMDGRLDYGAYADPATSQATLAIRSTILRVGAEIAHTGTNGAEMFEIASVTPLATE